MSGIKIWITNAPIADIMIIWAKSVEDDEMRGFIVERKENEGNRLITPAIKGKFSLRCSITGMILMDDLEVPEENMLPNVKGLKVSFESFRCNVEPSPLKKCPYRDRSSA